jgi:hypothetical protein
MFFLGFASLLVVIVAFCGIVLSRQMEGYRSTAHLAHSLEMLAAAEGGALHLEAAGPGQIKIGRCRLLAEAIKNGRSTIHVELVHRGGTIINQRTYTAHFRQEEGGQWLLRSVQP